MRLWPVLSVFAIVAGVLSTTAVQGPHAASTAVPSPRILGADGWLKGNTHTHTLWSDGDAAPEWTAKWYVDHDYDFLVLSDHNVLSVVQKYFPIKDGTRLTQERVDQITAAFGDGWVEERTRQVQQETRQEMRLKTLDELRAHFEADGSFVFIQGEEVTDAFGPLPVHLNAIGVEATIVPQKGATAAEVLRRNLQQVAAHAAETGRPVVAHVNHPNFGWGLTAEDLATVEETTSFEVYNGHPGVRNRGDAEHPSTDDLWDVVLTRRLRDLGFGVVYGIAADDTHHYFDIGPTKSNSGAGWIMVGSDRREPDAILEALRRGDFYSSSGVDLKTIQHDATGLTVSIEAQEGVTYRTDFIGTRDGDDAVVGEVLSSVEGTEARYDFRGDEWYVRAVVTSDRVHPRPSKTGDVERAWIQPVTHLTR